MKYNQFSYPSFIDGLLVGRLDIRYYLLSSFATKESKSERLLFTNSLSGFERASPIGQERVTKQKLLRNRERAGKFILKKLI